MTFETYEGPFEEVVPPGTPKMKDLKTAKKDGDTWARLLAKSTVEYGTTFRLHDPTINEIHDAMEKTIVAARDAAKETKKLR